MDRLEPDLRDRIAASLAGVIDPEMGMSVIDLGLIYEIDVRDGALVVTMTTTTRFCPAAGFLVDAVRARVAEFGLPDVTVSLTYDPPWTPERMRA
jgi:metal-sulfur cluster biosynthetic enzyme